MFEKYVLYDPRNNREFSTVTEESLLKRCECMLPKHLIENKSVLDVGSALGAMGEWSTLNGCSLYGAVEIQDTFLNKSKELLAGRSCNFYKTIEEINVKYDVVLASGILNGVGNPIEFLKKLCHLSNEYVVIETVLIPSDKSIIEVTNGKMIAAAGENYSGLVFLPSISAIDMLMSLNGFTERERLYPEKIDGCHDPYRSMNHPRCILRYKNTGNFTKLLSDIVEKENVYSC